MVRVVCPTRLLVLLSLVSPACNFFMRSRQGANNPTADEWPRNDVAGGFTKSADDGKDSQLPRTSIAFGCGEDCVDTAENSPSYVRGNFRGSSIPSSWTSTGEGRQEDFEQLQESFAVFLDSVAAQENNVNSRRGRVKWTRDVPGGTTDSARGQDSAVLQEKLTQMIKHIPTRMRLPAISVTPLSGVSQPDDPQKQSDHQDNERGLLSSWTGDFRKARPAVSDALNAEDPVFNADRLWPFGSRTFLSQTTTSDDHRDSSPPEVSAHLDTPSSKTSGQKRDIFDNAVLTKLCSDDFKYRLDLETDFLLQQLCEAMAAAYSRTYADSVDVESWQNNTNAWRERLSSLVNAKFTDPETNTDFERTVLTDRPDLSKSKHVNEFPDRNMPDVEDAVEQSLTDRLGINTGSNEWVELSEGETFDSDPVNAHASGNNKNTMEESLDDEDASFESFRYPDSVSEDVNPSWVFTGIDSDESDQPGGREEVVTKRRPMDKDKKVFVYGQDDRLRVFLSQMRKFPFSNIARLSTGCTGTLVTPRHVLTAAHCVHNGLDFRSNLEMLKIEIPDTMGFRTYYAQKISVPTGWLRDVDSNSINGYQSGRHAAYDYAVVRLKLAVAGRNRFLPLAVPRADVLTLDIHFLAFPESDHGLWRSVCPASSHMARMDGNLILTRCDAAVGNSGAAVFTNEPHEGMRVVGVLSNTMHVAHHRSFDRYSIITALTWPKLADICRQLGSLAQQYNVCPPFRYMRREPPPLRLTAIPFFGKRQGGPV